MGPQPQKMKILYFYSIEKSAKKSNFNIDSICQGNIGTIFHHYMIVNICKCLQVCAKHLVNARKTILAVSEDLEQILPPKMICVGYEDNI